MEAKLIACYGECWTPQRYWDWIVCSQEFFDKNLKQHGWVNSTCKKYLTKKQLEYLQMDL